MLLRRAPLPRDRQRRSSRVSATVASASTSRAGTRIWSWPCRRPSSPIPREPPRASAAATCPDPVTRELCARVRRAPADPDVACPGGRPARGRNIRRPRRCFPGAADRDLHRRQQASIACRRASRCSSARRAEAGGMRVAATAARPQAGVAVSSRHRSRLVAAARPPASRPVCSGFRQPVPVEGSRLQRGPLDGTDFRPDRPTSLRGQRIRTSGARRGIAVAAPARRARASHSQRRTRSTSAHW